MSADQVCGVPDSSSPATPRSSTTTVGGPDESVVKRLALRQMCGVIRSSSKCPCRGAQVKPMGRLPCRLAFCLRDIVPFSALQSGHIFLGFSKCGQFLLSYTQSTVDYFTTGDWLLRHQYRLHWWLFTPYKKARKVSEMLLFSSRGIPSILRISFCQWPNDSTKMLVYGYSMQPENCDPTDALPAYRSPPYRASSSPSSINEDNVNYSSATSDSNNDLDSEPAIPEPIICYMTVTAVPALDNCPGCRDAASQCDEEQVAEAWDSCIRLSCLEHAVTVHTSFDLVTPYPDFEPRISLRRTNYVVINTGNWLHSLYIGVESSQSVQSQVLTCKSRNDRNLPSSGHHTDWSSLTSSSSSSASSSDEDSFEEPSTVWPSASSEQALPLSVYDFDQYKEKDDNFEAEEGDDDDDAVWPAFRRRRQADRKYEFIIDDEEDQPGLTLESMRVATQERRLTQALSSEQQQQQDEHSMDRDTEAEDVVSNSNHGNMMAKVCTRFTRRFVQMAGEGAEQITVVTDVEEDDHHGEEGGEHVNPTGFHTALPLEVRGSHYCQLDMISNDANLSDQRLVRLTDSVEKCVTIEQRSVDLEVFCHAAAEHLVATFGSQMGTFRYCYDYDVEIIDFDPTSNDVLCLAFVLIDILSDKSTQTRAEHPIKSDRESSLYQGSFYFTWNVDRAVCTTLMKGQQPGLTLVGLGSSSLTTVRRNHSKMNICQDPRLRAAWHPARPIATTLRRSWRRFTDVGHVRVLTNDAVVLHGQSVKTIVDGDHFLAIIQDKFN